MLPVERSWYVCLPLIAGGEALGSLWLAAPGTPDETAENGGEIDGDRMDFYVAVAETLSFAIANLRLRETLRYQALRDPLTGLFNRRYLHDVVDHELQRAASRNQELSVVMFDIDHFKRLNDAFGHAAGDTVLARLGALLREWVRADDIAVRYGGEEFTIVLPDTSSELAVARAESLRQAIASLSVEHDGQPLVQVTISAGIATFPVHGIDREALIQSADQALYASKRAGRNRVSLAPLPVAEQSQISVAV
ncbi:MAG: sensor domain-containing diguanylate cyclase [Gammaproteobacteria bacterium]|nr:sensor domain-containing diguanylate cyclase [Gammaproteobacteria bacterium]